MGVSFLFWNHHIMRLNWGLPKPRSIIFLLWHWHFILRLLFLLNFNVLTLILTNIWISLYFVYSHLWLLSVFVSRSVAPLVTHFAHFRSIFSEFMLNVGPVRFSTFLVEISWVVEVNGWCCSWSKKRFLNAFRSLTFFGRRLYIYFEQV